MPEPPVRRFTGTIVPIRNIVPHQERSCNSTGTNVPTNSEALGVTLHSDQAGARSGGRARVGASWLSTGVTRSRRPGWPESRMLGQSSEENPLQPSEDPPLGDYLDEWLERRVTQLRPSSWRGYRNTIGAYLKPTLGAVPLSELDRRTIERLYTQLLRCGGRRGKPLSPKTVEHAHSVLRGALKDAVLDGLLAVNPAAHARRPQHDPRETEIDEDPQIWNVEQAAHFLDEVDDHPQRALWHLAVGTGARRGEMLGLRWCDVDLDARVIRICRSLSRVGGVTRLLGTKTSRNRTLSIGESVAAALIRERQAQEARRHAAGPAWRDEWGLVFTDGDGTPLDPMRVTREFRRLVRVLDVPVIRLHSLRHTHASLLLAQGAPMKLVSERLGHAKIAMTMDNYAHLLPTMDGEATANLDASLREARRGPA